MDDSRIIRMPDRRPRGAAPDLARLRRPDRKPRIEVVAENDPRLLKGIRPELQVLQEHHAQAGRGLVLGIALTDMSRDELLGLCAMLIAANKGETAEPAQNDDP